MTRSKLKFNVRLQLPSLGRKPRQPDLPGFLALGQPAGQASRGQKARKPLRAKVAKAGQEANGRGSRSGRDGSLPFSPVTLDVTGVDHLAFIRLTSVLKELGFSPVSDFAQDKSIVRALVHGERPVVALIVEVPGVKHAVPHVQLLTRFDDFSSQTTTNAEGKEAPHPPFLRWQQVPGMAASELWSAHCQGLDALLDKHLVPVPVTRDGFFPYYWEWVRLVQTYAKDKAGQTSRTQAAVHLGPLPEVDWAPFLRRFTPRPLILPPLLPAPVARPAALPEPVAEVAIEAPVAPPSAPKVEAPAPAPVSEPPAMVVEPPRPKVEPVRPTAEEVAAIRTAMADLQEPEELTVTVPGLDAEPTFDAPTIHPGDPPPFALDLPPAAAMNPGDPPPFAMDAPSAMAPAAEPTAAPQVAEVPAAPPAAPARAPESPAPIEAVAEAAADGSAVAAAGGEAAADALAKGLCPHCNKKLLSAWASKCNHCKQPLR